jgi:pSer/pThr/pTyr-binding forkhead associated (FHA) protein
MEVVLDWDRGISRRHFTLERSPNGWLIADQSLNGTLVNGEKVPGTQLLHDRDLVQIGETALAFRDPAR